MKGGLTPDEAVGCAVDHGLVDAERATAEPLGGGVSNDTVLVTDGRDRVVVKRALSRLRTEVAWHAPASRALDEARCLRLAGELTPGSVPAVLAEDPATSTIALAAAPDGWRDWRDELLAGRVDPAVGSALGAVLGTWHARTSSNAELVAGLDGLDRMESLRLAPFHDTVAAHHQDLAEQIGAAADRLRTARACFVHGDFSPKNVLAGADGVWVIDFEVAHRGNPVFDLAFMITHLLLKSTARPGSRPRLERTAEAFLGAYRNTGAPPAEAAELRVQTGCLVLARVDGTSPATYLTRPQRDSARALGRRLIAGEAELWKL